MISTGAYTSLDLKEAADFLGIQEDVLHDNVKAGAIPAYRPGRRWVFLREELFDIKEKIKERKQVLEIQKIISENAIAVPNFPCIYFLLKRGVIVYIGKSINLLNRLGAHTHQKSFDSFTYYPCAQEKLDETEALLIGAFRPVLNVMLKL